MSAFSGGWTSIVSGCKDNPECMSHGEEGKGRWASALKYGMGIVGMSTRHLKTHSHWSKFDTYLAQEEAPAK